MPLNLRPATALDVPAMHRIRKSVSENTLSDGAIFGEADYLPFLGPVGETWVGEFDGKMAGFGSVDRVNASVWALFVDPDFEGRGVGKALLNQMVARARSCGIPKLMLTTTPGTRAEQFYLRQGWQPTGTAANGEIILAFALQAQRSE